MWISVERGMKNENDEKTFQIIKFTLFFHTFYEIRNTYITLNPQCFTHLYQKKEWSIIYEQQRNIITGRSRQQAAAFETIDD